jgi:hypothetical protein
MSLSFALQQPTGAEKDNQESLNAYRDSLTNAMWGTFVPMGLVGAAASYMRLRHFRAKVLQKFK